MRKGQNERRFQGRRQRCLSSEVILSWDLLDSKMAVGECETGRMRAANRTEDS